ncbi:MAG TPA: twin-arginine translocation signal domain-containing protein, partial [Dongiaceae bacterium]
MKRNWRQGLSRRELLQASGGLAAGAALSGLLPTAARAAGELTMWWWGEQELPGLQAVVNDAVKSY